MHSAKIPLSFNRLRPSYRGPFRFLKALDPRGRRKLAYMLWV